MDMDLSWCPVCERAIVEREETSDPHQQLQHEGTLMAKAGKSLGLTHSNSKAQIAINRPRKHGNPSTRPPAASKPRTTGRAGELTERGAVYAPRGGLYCSEACRAIDELSGQRAFEDLAVLSCFVTPRIGGRVRSEAESDYCASSSTTTSGTDEDGGSESRRCSIGLDSNPTELTSSSGGATGLRPKTPLERPTTVRSQSDLPTGPGVAIQSHHTLADGRQCWSVEGSGLRKKQTPILLAPNGTPLVRPTFPQKHQQNRQIGSVPTRSQNHPHARVFEPLPTPAVSLASDYGLFFSPCTSSEAASTPRQARGGRPTRTSWSWDHLPADVPQYPAMNLALVRRSMGVEEKPVMAQSRKKLFIFNQNL
ncbi:hypothetical protein CROQUDRAFT_133184 [Cronartium quercuum f. sp. fusiforme G11]|uniref:Uncharacterized protein n=1 Tax=Cronartium quercuum f. sp. fusiforme G11 TaxID=708437 RepID=A0A9P6TBJ4_9BASI|nr:hypothetical protein CROQUDRAFT_133184 [Cronartium quercuum f. sp. fusiforme G11]